MRITRFLRNSAVTVEEMLAEAGARTAARCVGREVLVIQDTTVVRSTGGGGDYLHAAVALDAADGAILGLVEGCFLRRTSGRKAERRGLPIEEKESFRWLEGAEQAASVCAGARRITVKESLAYAAWVCARLGGWTGYYGKPGPVVMLNGWLEIQATKRAIQTLGYSHNV